MWEEADFTYEDFEVALNGEMQLCILSVGAEFRVKPYWPGHDDCPPEGGDVELGTVRVLGALVGPDRLEASPQELAEIRRNFNSEALIKVFEWCCAEAS